MGLLIFDKEYPIFLLVLADFGLRLVAGVWILTLVLLDSRECMILGDFIEFMILNALGSTVDMETCPASENMCLDADPSA